jgi:hypothetical protein
MAMTNASELPIDMKIGSLRFKVLWRKFTRVQPPINNLTQKFQLAPAFVPERAIT